MSIPAQDLETVADLMTGDLVALGLDRTVGEAREVLTHSGLHAIPVLDRGEAVGIITLADCEERADDDPLADAATGPVVTIAADATISEAARVMRAEHIHHLVVTEGRHPEAIGILSSFDLLYVLAS